MLPEPTLFAAFLVAALVICVTPGPDMLYVMSFGMSQGWRGGLAAASGVAIGMLTHTCLAAFGVSALLRTASWPIDVLRIAGAIYLLYLGVQMIRSSHQSLTVNEKRSELPLWKIVANSSIVNITNPKILIFYLTFLPQFVSSNTGSFALQMFTLGVLFAIMGFVTDSTIGIASGFLANRLIGNPSAMRAIDIVGGIILIALAGFVAFMSL